MTLTMTGAAADAIRVLVTSELDSTAGGARLQLPDQGTPSRPQVHAVRGPAPRDEIHIHAGAHLYLDPATATALVGRVLDARTSPGGEIEFWITG